MWTLSSKNKPSQSMLEKAEDAYNRMISRADIGFKDLEQLAQIKSSVEKLAKPQGTLVIFGIGGSSMGTMAIAQALFPNHWQEKFVFFDNVDAVTFEQKLSSIKDPETAQWVVISKSGKTIETLSCYDFSVQFFQESQGMDIRKNTVVITEEKESPLYQMAKENNMDVLTVPLNVGGRFSVFTPVGLYPLACAGISLDDIEAGYKQAIANKENTFLLTSYLYESLQREEFSFYNFYYTDRLVHWGEWLQQLWSESLSKSENRQGEPSSILNTIIPCRGATYQHSVLQQVAEGLEKKMVCFVRVADAEKGSIKLKKSFSQNHLMEGKTLGELLAVEAKATELALQEKSISTFSLQGEQLTAQSVSELMMLWMLVVGTLGELLQVDAYNQPGVESGKRLAREFLSSSN